jgi:hypothetical protein
MNNENEKQFVTMETAKDAFKEIMYALASDEMEYLLDNFDECVEGITEEEFEEEYDGDAYKLPIENIVCNFVNIRVLQLYFENEIELSSVSDDELINEMKKRSLIEEE